MLNKWSDHTFDVCPFCGGHMGIFAPTYAFNFCFVGCSHCGGESQSAYVKGTFQWVLPNMEMIEIHMKAYGMMQEAIK